MSQLTMYEQSPPPGRRGSLILVAGQKRLSRTSVSSMISPSSPRKFSSVFHPFPEDNSLPKFPGGRRGSRQLKKLTLPSVDDVTTRGASPVTPDIASDKWHPTGSIAEKEKRRSSVVEIDMFKALKGFFKDVKDVQKRIKNLQDMGNLRNYGNLSKSYIKY